MPLVISQRAATWRQPLTLIPCCHCRITVRNKAIALLQLLWCNVPACLIAQCVMALRVPGSCYGTASGYWFCAGCWRRHALIKFAERYWRDEFIALCWPRFVQSGGCTVVSTSNLRYWLQYSIEASDAEICAAYEAFRLGKEAV